MFSAAVNNKKRLEASFKSFFTDRFATPKYNRWIRNIFSTVQSSILMAGLLLRFRTESKFFVLYAVIRQLVVDLSRIYRVILLMTVIKNFYLILR